MGAYPLCVYRDRNGSRVGTTGIGLTGKPRAGSPQAEIHCDRVGGAGRLPNLSGQPDAAVPTVAGRTRVGLKRRDDHGAVSDCLRAGTKPIAGTPRQYLRVPTGPLRLGDVHRDRGLPPGRGRGRRMASPNKSAAGGGAQRRRGVRGSGRAGDRGVLKNGTRRDSTCSYEELLSIEI